MYGTMTTQMPKPERSGAWPQVADEDGEHAGPNTSQVDPRDDLGPEYKNKVAEIANDVAQARRVAEAGA